MTALPPSPPSTTTTTTTTTTTSKTLTIWPLTPSTSPSSQTRIIIRVCVTDIPGNPLARHQTLGDIFCHQFLHRPLKSVPHPAGYDGVVILDGFDSDRPVKRWFIYDLNVERPLSREEMLADVPHRVFLASRAGRETGTWSFIPRDQWNERAKAWCKSYAWGGKMEQKMVAKMRVMGEGEGKEE